VNIYHATVSHDKGIVQFSIPADTKQKAIHLLCVAENMPERAILNITLYKEHIENE
jgi:hypothetical protein